MADGLRPSKIPEGETVRESKDYVLFWGGEFSQWYRSDFEEDGIRFTSAEQYMMYSKAKLFGDEGVAQKILSTANVKKIKALGREVGGFVEEVWVGNREDIVFRGNVLKFSQNEDLKNILLSYPDKVFVEASPVDRIWGIGLHFDDVACDDRSNWNGLNLLGEAITRVRDMFEKEL